MSSQLLIAEQLHTNMYNAVGHRIRLVAFHQCFHDECIMLNKRFCKGDLPERKAKAQQQLTVMLNPFKEDSICFQNCTHITKIIYANINVNMEKRIPCNLDLATC